MFAVTLLLVLATGVALAQGPIPLVFTDPLHPPDTGGQREAGPLATPLGTAFTYQGQLDQSGSPYTGACDFQFSLWDAASGGTQIGSTQTQTGVTVTDGLFTVSLDFGSSVFTGDARWLGLAVRCPAGSGSYTALSPRQALAATPYALYARAVPWSGLTGVPAGFADGTDNDTTYTAGNGLTLTGNQFSVSFAGSGAANLAARSDHNHWGQTWTSGSASGAGLSVSNSGTGNGLSGSSYAGYGVTGDSGGSYGGYFTGPSGVYGLSDTNAGYGGYFTNTRSIGSGGVGVYGGSANPLGIGVLGENNASMYSTIGVKGSAASGTGVYGVGGDTGVHGEGPVGVEGQAAGSGTGVAGRSTSGYGVTGQSTTGSGGYFSSVAGHALVTDKPSLIAGPNPKQIAMLRWYDAIQTGQTFATGDRPHDMAFDGASIWIANEGGNTVTRLQANDGKLLGTYAAGTQPHGVAFDGANVWVTNMGSNKVTKVRASDGVTLGAYNVGSGPRGVAFDGTDIWVANFGSSAGTTVTRLRASTGALVATYTVGSAPDHIAFDGTNIWVTLRYENKVAKVRPSDGVVLGKYSVGTGPEELCFDGANIWVANIGSSNVTKLRASDGTLLGTYAIGSEVWGIVFDGSHIWAIGAYTKVVKKLDARTGTVIGTYNVGRAPMSLVFDGANVWVSNYDDDTVQKL